MAGLGIVVALEAEAKALGLRRPRPGLQPGAVPGVQVFLSGMKDGPARAAANALADAGVDALLSFGTSGGLEPRLESGSLVCPRSVIDQDGRRYACDEAWRARLVTAAGERELDDGALLCTRAVLLNSGIKFLARAQSNAVAVDLESSGVAAVAQERGLPFLALRAIVDDCEARLPDGVIEATDAYGRPKPMAMLVALVSGPQDWLLLPRVAADFARANAALRAIATAAPDFAWRTAS
jgi:nucleoside phosphorylase